MPAGAVFDSGDGHIVFVDHQRHADPGGVGAGQRSFRCLLLVCRDAVNGLLGGSKPLCCQ